MIEEKDKNYLGLDEAAERYTDNPDTYATWPEHYGDFAFVDDIALVEKAFKAGAKWMAEQGVSKEMVISKLPNGDTFFSRSIEFDEVGVPNHTEVIVQIRQK